jgi:hypothetical protein
VQRAGGRPPLAFDEGARNVSPTRTQRRRAKSLERNTLTTTLHRLLRWRRAQRLILVAAMSVALVSLTAAPAWSAVSAEQQGAALLGQIQSGQTSCSKLSSGDLELMGRYDMGRLMGSTARYDAMNAQMLANTGASGEQSAYRFMGMRLGGCATGNGPVAFGTMMGMMGTSEMGASYGSAYRGGAYSSSMMGRGFGSNQTAGSGGLGAGGIVAIVLGSLALLALIVVLATRRTPRRPTQPRPA